MDEFNHPIHLQVLVNEFIHRIHLQVLVNEFIHRIHLQVQHSVMHSKRCCLFVLGWFP